MTLKLMTYAPTGALVAAPTAGLPEQIGGRAELGLPLHLDPRRVVLGVRAARPRLHRRGRGFRPWLRRPRSRARRRQPATAADHVPRRRLTRPRPRRSSTTSRATAAPAPVRIGNGAADQLQLDIYGEALDPSISPTRTACSCHTRAGPTGRGLIDWLCEHWDQPEEGIWETRGGRQNFTYGRLMSWVALDRAIRLAAEPRPARRHRPLDGQRDAIYEQIMEPRLAPRTRGLRAALRHRRARRGAAAACRSVGLHRADRPDVAVDPARDGRRNSSPTASSTGTTRAPPPTACAAREGTFTMCTFWYVDALARSGRLDDAQLAFEKMLTYGNHLGLYSEEIGPHRRAARQLPAGLQPPVADQRRDEPRLPARPRRRRRRTRPRADRWCHTAQRSWLSSRPARAARFPPVPKMITRCWCF